MDRASQTSIRFSRRTGVVWLIFAVAMTLVVGLFSLAEGGLTGDSFIAAKITAVEDDPVFQLTAELQPDRWTGIVIHHLGRPAGDAESIHRLHQSFGYHGLGYHFIIGNGNGLGDGIIQVGYRWDQQLPGAHVVGPAGETHNAHSIGICLVGDGDRRAFTRSQMESLISLVQRLQRRLEIPARRVFLHRDLSDEVTSPGRYFATAQLDEQVIE